MKNNKMEFAYFLVNGAEEERIFLEMMNFSNKKVALKYGECSSALYTIDGKLEKILHKQIGIDHGYLEEAKDYVRNFSSYLHDLNYGLQKRIKDHSKLLSACRFCGHQNSNRCDICRGGGSINIVYYIYKEYSKILKEEEENK